LENAQQALYAAVAAVTALSMKTPYRCPYCEQTSMRRWNMSTHVIRKHKDLFNPLPAFKDLTYSNSHPPQPPVSEPSNSFLPKNEMSDPLQMGGKSPSVQIVIQEINQMNGVEFATVMMEMNRILSISKFF
jgi:uncharacterized C2H2 Zn-finger protein